MEVLQIAYRDFFSRSLPLQEFLGDQVPYSNFLWDFFRDQVPCWDGGGDKGGADSTVAILILTLATMDCLEHASNK